MPNTLKAHQLIAIAPEEVKQQLVDDLFKAYFEDGKDIGHIDYLLETASLHGMDPHQTRIQLAAKQGLEQVEDDLAFASQAGVTGVPFFVINRKYALTGAQPQQRFCKRWSKLVQRVRMKRDLKFNITRHLHEESRVFIS